MSGDMQLLFLNLFQNPLEIIRKIVCVVGNLGQLKGLCSSAVGDAAEPRHRLEFIEVDFARVELVVDNVLAHVDVLAVEQEHDGVGFPRDAGVLDRDHLAHGDLEGDGALSDVRRRDARARRLCQAGHVPLGDGARRRDAGVVCGSGKVREGF